jgi:predicted component of type VI protein secretion system
VRFPTPDASSPLDARNALQDVLRDLFELLNSFIIPDAAMQQPFTKSVSALKLGEFGL